MKSHTMTGGGGVTIHVDETGTDDGPAILFIHGYTQSRCAWDRQLHSDLADDFRVVAMDLRGHGNSEKPANAYDDPALWADDVQAVIDELSLDQPTLVGWSYGGLVMSDYSKTHGTDDVAGVNYVGAISKIGSEAANDVIGEVFFDHIPGFTSTDAEESIDTLSAFVNDCVYGDLSARDQYYMLGYNAIVPPYVRAGLLERESNNDKTLRELDIPTLFTHGEEDTVVLPAATEEHADYVADADVSWYSDVGHSPFWERPAQFNEELRAFVQRV